jgi:NAD+ diphosphatase
LTPLHIYSMKNDPYLPFISQVNPGCERQAGDLWFAVHDKTLLVKVTGTHVALPSYEEITKEGFAMSHVMHLGSLRGRACYAAELSSAEAVKAPFELYGLRSVVTGLLSEELFGIASKALHLVQWNRVSRFCSACGAATKDKIDERAKACPACGRLDYPRISPAVIVAITRGNRILLAHNKNARTGFHSVLAGFVEPGESFEQCVRREVYEEVALEVDNIRYFGSQPWPFPDSLMVGFTADYAQGEIKVDGVEIEAADWYDRDSLPPIPPVGSISRKLIDAFVQKEAS